MQTITAGGMRIPKLGLGTWGMRGSECTDAVLRALELGYRHIDTAQMYGNEDAVGAALARTSVTRDDIHVTTKVWWENLSPDAMRRAMDDSLRKLRTPYVDLYLIHWPAPEMNLGAALDQMVRFQEQGVARHIGVSNFPVALLIVAVEEIGAPIVCNQVEYHVNLEQSRQLRYLRLNDMALTAYRPLSGGRLAGNAVLETIAARHGVSAAQVALAWLLGQEGVAAIPKAAREVDQKANLEAAELRLDAEDLAAIAKLPKHLRLINPSFAPEWDPPAQAD
jgi:2,5-diketo-D-gluconate reductase B